MEKSANLRVEPLGPSDNAKKQTGQERRWILSLHAETFRVFRSCAGWSDTRREEAGHVRDKEKKRSVLLFAALLFCCGISVLS
jgi:hypothetical protein